MSDSRGLPAGSRVRMQTATSESLRELANKPNTTVMEPTYDSVHAPYAADVVRSCALRLRAATLEADGDESAIRQVIESDEALRAFVEDHQVLSQKLTSIDLCRSDAAFDAICQVLDLHALSVRGCMDDTEARTKASSALFAFAREHSKS